MKKRTLSDIKKDLCRVKSDLHIARIDARECAGNTSEIGRRMRNRVDDLEEQQDDLTREYNNL